MQLNMSEYNDMSFYVNEMNNLASSINNFNNYDSTVLSRNNATAKETEFLNLGPAPRTTIKRPIVNPIVDGIKNSGKNVGKQFIERPQIVDYQPIKKEGRDLLTYEDLLANMNISIKNGLMYNSNNIQHNKPIKNNPLQPRLHQTQPKNMKVPKGGNYILNKYFKDQLQMEEKQPVQIPRTKEEYKKFLINKHIEKIIARKRIEQIKSKKMLFNNQNVNISQGLGLGLDSNNLFRLNR